MIRRAPLGLCTSILHSAIAVGGRRGHRYSISTIRALLHSTGWVVGPTCSSFTTLTLPVFGWRMLSELRGCTEHSAITAQEVYGMRRWRPKSRPGRKQVMMT